MTNDEPQLEYPHYTNDKWSEACVIWGCKAGASEWFYSDRMSNNRDRHRAARKAAEPHHNNTASWWEAYAAAYYPGYRLVCLQAGSNLSNGYPYWVVGIAKTDVAGS